MGASKGTAFSPERAFADLHFAAPSNRPGPEYAEQILLSRGIELANLQAQPANAIPISTGLDLSESRAETASSADDRQQPKGTEEADRTTDKEEFVGI